MANGSQVKFDGYLAIYNDSDKNKMLPDMVEGDIVKQVNSKPETFLPNHQLVIILKQP